MSDDLSAAAARRPTPLHPHPSPTQPARESGDERVEPPALGSDAIAILDGRTFMFSDSLGDVASGSIGGLLHDDTRFVSRWELTLEGRPFSLLKSGAVDYYSAAFFLTNPDLPGLPVNTLSVRRLRFVGSGVLEQVAVFNASSEPVRFELRLGCDADFADLFEVKSTVRDRSAHIVAEATDCLRFRYEVPRFRAETLLSVQRSEIIDRGIFKGIENVVAHMRPRIDGREIVWDVDLPSRHLLVTLLEVALGLNGAELRPVHDGFGEPQQPVEGPLTAWLACVPTFESDSALLESVFDQSVVDLAALRISGELRGEPYVLPAAGLPWFMTLFGHPPIGRASG